MTQSGTQPGTQPGTAVQLEDRRMAVIDALDTLAARDPAIDRGLKEAGFPAPRVLAPGFGALMAIIIGQQVSTASAAAILKRLEEAGGLEVDRFQTLSDDDLTAIGLSRAKMRYGRALAERVSDGRLDLASLARVEPRQAHEALIEVPGIGRWTAEIYRMFALADADVFPAGDLALREGVRHLLALDARPTIAETDALTLRWAPFRSSAALLVWRLYRLRRSIAVLGADGGA